jgi:hypothetical protein
MIKVFHAVGTIDAVSHTYRCWFEEIDENGTVERWPSREYISSYPVLLSNKTKVSPTLGRKFKL